MSSHYIVWKRSLGSSIVYGLVVVTLASTPWTAGSTVLNWLREGCWLGLLDVALVEDGLRQLDEGSLDVDICLGRGLQELDVVFPGNGLSSLLRHHSLVIHVTPDTQC